MIIKISEQFEKELIVNGLSESHLRYINNILERMAANKLFFYATKDFYNFLLEKYSNRFSCFVVSMLNNIQDVYYTKKSEIERIGPLILIENDCYTPKSIMNCFHIPLCCLPSELTPYLCSENPDDSMFYFEMYKKMTAHTAYTYIQLEGFGGSSAKTYIENWIEQKKVFFVVADSDIKYPGSDFGSTAQNIIDTFKCKNFLFSNYFILNVHEKENMLPLEMIKTKSLSKDIKSTINYIIKLEHNCDYRDFFDFKHGLQKDYIDSLKSLKEYKEIIKFFEPILNYLKINNLYDFSGSNPTIVSGIGGDIITKIIKQGVNIDRILPFLTKRQKASYDSINELILKYGYCYIGKIS